MGGNAKCDENIMGSQKYIFSNYFVGWRCQCNPLIAIQSGALHAKAIEQNKLRNVNLLFQHVLNSILLCKFIYSAVVALLDGVCFNFLN